MIASAASSTTSRPTFRRINAWKAASTPAAATIHHHQRERRSESACSSAATASSAALAVATWTVSSEATIRKPLSVNTASSTATTSPSVRRAVATIAYAAAAYAATT